MDGDDLDLFLTKLDELQRDILRISEILNSFYIQMNQTWDALEQVRAELNRTKGQYATLKALWPRRYLRAG